MKKTRKQNRLARFTPIATLLITLLIDDFIGHQGLVLPGVAAQQFKFNFGGGGQQFGGGGQHFGGGGQQRQQQKPKPKNPEDDYYKIMGVKPDATEDQIKKAFKKQAIKYHPDKNREDPEKAKEKFQKIANAYEVLSDPDKRRVYDQ